MKKLPSIDILKLIAVKNIHLFGLKVNILNLLIYNFLIFKNKYPYSKVLFV